MRSRKRWVGVAALCAVAVVPEAHAQIGSSAPAGTQPAGVSAGAPAVVSPAAVARAGGAVTRASRLEAVTVQVVNANAAAQALGAAARPASSRPAGARPAGVSAKGVAAGVIKTGAARAGVVKTGAARAGVVKTGVVKTGVVKTGTASMASVLAQAQTAVSRAARLEVVTAKVVGANTAALGLAAGFTGTSTGTASVAESAAGTNSAGTSPAGATSAGRSAAGTSPSAAALPALTSQVRNAFAALGAPQRLAGQLAAAPVGLPKAVVVRQPPRNFGSGYLSSYGSLNHRTSSARGFVAAAKDPNGCLVVGDSIGARTASYLDVLAKKQFGQSCAYEVWNGRPTEGAVNALEHIAKTHGLPKRVVVISGANDIFNPPAFRAQVERAAKIVGPKRTLTWSSVFVRRPLTGTASADLENSRWLNIVLSRTAAQHPNVRVVNWYGFLAQRQRRLSTYLLDGVHPTTAGRRALAELIAAKW